MLDGYVYDGWMIAAFVGAILVAASVIYVVLRLIRTILVAERHESATENVPEDVPVPEAVAEDVERITVDPRPFNFQDFWKEMGDRVMSIHCDKGTLRIDNREADAVFSTRFVKIYWWNKVQRKDKRRGEVAIFVPMLQSVQTKVIMGNQEVLDVINDGKSVWKDMDPIEMACVVRIVDSVRGYYFLNIKVLTDTGLQQLRADVRRDPIH